MTAHWEHQLQGMAERNQAYQPFMQALEQRIDGLMSQVKSGPIPDSLRHLPKVERPAFKRKSEATQRVGHRKREPQSERALKQKRRMRAPLLLVVCGGVTQTDLRDFEWHLLHHLA